MKSIEILGMYGGNYIITDGEEGAPVQIASDADLRDHLRSRGLTDSRIDREIKALKISPRKITLTVGS